MAGHRLTWEFFRGEIPDSLTFDHLCRNTSCVNPWHGDLVPNAVNIRRGGHATVTHCPAGHPYDETNTRYASRGYGRVCRICRAASSQAFRERQRAKHS